MQIVCTDYSISLVWLAAINVMTTSKLSSRFILSEEPGRPSLVVCLSRPGTGGLVYGAGRRPQRKRAREQQERQPGRLLFRRPLEN